MRLFSNYILFLVCFLIAPFALAEQAYPIITFSCNQAEDVLKIKNEVKWGNAGKNFNFSAENGTYNPWDWVQIVDRKGRKLVRQKKSVELNCDLSGTLYRVLLEPKLFNPDLNGNCGNKLSARVSVYMGELAMIENKDLEKFCVGNARVIRGIKVFGKKRELKLYEIAKHKFY